MGSLDWKGCEYCEYWVFHPYLRDPDGIALCAWCWDFEEEGGILESEEHWWCFSQCQLRRERYLQQLRRERYLQNFRVLPVALRLGTIIHTMSWY